MKRIRVTISDLMYDQRSRSIPAPGILFSGGGTSNSEIRRNASKCQGKWPDQTPRPSVRLTRGVGSGQHLASVSQEGRENANIDAGLGFIWRTLVKGPCVRSTSRHGVGRSRVLRLSAEILRGGVAAPSASRTALRSDFVLTPCFWQRGANNLSAALSSAI